MAASLVVGGWVVAVSGAALALVFSRLLAARMEAVARACHELRGPLTAARLGLQVANRGGELSPARVRAIDLELCRAALALEDLAAAHAGRPTRRTAEKVEVRQLLADSVEAWRASASARGIDLGLTWSTAHTQVWGDRLRLAQATGNLIANAIEHGAAPIEIRCRAEDSRVRIEVVDGGTGLPAPVTQLARRPGGGRGARGRGLAIAMKIAEEHGGRLAAAPSESGARLVLELPAAGAPLRTPAVG